LKDRKHKEKEVDMKMWKRMGTIAILAAFCLLVSCSDEVKEEAMNSWEVFKMQETESLKTVEAGLAPHDFSYRIVEVEDLPYRFKAFISFKRGHIYQESAYSFSEGKWIPVEYGSNKENTLEQKEEEYERVMERVEELEEEIDDERDFLEEYREKAEKMDRLQKELDALQETAATLKAEITRLED